MEFVDATPENSVDPTPGIQRYGHAGGATDFFRRFENTAGSRIPYLLASHPHPADRVRELDAAIAANSYPVAAVVSLGADLLPAPAAPH